MPPILRRPKRKSEKKSLTDLPTPPSLEDKIYSQSVYYPILAPPPISPDDIIDRPPFPEETGSEGSDLTSVLSLEDDLTSDILKEIRESGFGSVLKGAPPKNPIVLHVEELAIKKFKAAIEAYLTAGEKHLELNFYGNASCLYSCAVLCVFLSEDTFQAAHLMKELGTKLPANVVNSHIFQGVRLLLKATLLKNISYLKQAEKWLFCDTNHMYQEEKELIERAVREARVAIETQAFDA